MAGSYTINLTAYINLTASTLTIDNTTAGISLIIDGMSYGVSGQNIAGVRPFTNASGSILTFQNISITDGNATGDGGAIRSLGPLTLIDSVISANDSDGNGGGIYVSDTQLTLTSSYILGNDSGDNGGGVYASNSQVTISGSGIGGNTAVTYGGGIYFTGGTNTLTNSTVTGNNAERGGGIYRQGGETTVDSSTIDDNRADYGGGIYAQGGEFAVTNTTITGNTAVNSGGGLNNNASTTTVTNSTITGNTANNGGGVFHYNGDQTLIANLISGNTGITSGDEIVKVGGTLTADAFNVFGHSGETNAQAFFGFTPGASDLSATSDGTTPTALASILNTTLASNGGPTETHALVAGSPAIDFGPTADCAAAPVNGLDQRGETRSIDIPGTGDDGGANLCDAGAFEVQLPPTATLTITKETAPAGGTDFPFTIDPGTYDFDLKWGSPGSGNGEFNYTTGVAVNALGNVYVVDSLNDRVQKFDSSGGYLSQWGGTGNGNGQFNGPRGVAVDADGNVYVVDTFNQRIQKFDGSGNYLAQWGTLGSGNGQLNGPYGVAVDAAGNVYVAEYNNNRIQKFDSSGNYLAQWGTLGSGNGQFSHPRAVALDALGNIFVADTDNHRIQKLDSSGNYLAQWGTLGSGNGQLNSPYGVAVDAAGNVYIADTGNDRIQKFSSSGGYLGQWGGNGNGNGQFNNPIGVTIVADGKVYVADGSNNRIQVFTPGLSTILDDGQSDSFSLTPGEYLISELVPDGWTLDNIDCDGGSPTYGDTTAAVTLTDDDDVTCTFTNTADFQPMDSFCPVDNADVGMTMTDLIGTGQGNTTKGYRTRKLVVPNSDDVVSLYGQLAAVDVGVMKYVRFLPQGYPKVQIYAPTSPAYRTYAVDWWGSDLPADANNVKGQFFWGKKGNKAPRAFVLWPTYDMEEEYANVFVTFDESNENHVAWEPGFIPTPDAGDLHPRNTSRRRDGGGATGDCGQQQGHTPCLAECDRRQRVAR